MFDFGSIRGIIIVKKRLEDIIGDPIGIPMKKDSEENLKEILINQNYNFGAI